MAAMPVLMPLHREAGLIRLVASTYQAVSGGGIAGVGELEEQVVATAAKSAALAVRRRCRCMPTPKKFISRSPSTYCPMPGRATKDGRTRSCKLLNESRKILGSRT